MAQVKSNNMLTSQKKQERKGGKEGDIKHTVRNNAISAGGKKQRTGVKYAEEQSGNIGIISTPDEGIPEELIGFSMGSRGLKISYDPFFKLIFNPDVHSDRLSAMLSLYYEAESGSEAGLIPGIQPDFCGRFSADYGCSG